MTRKFYTLFIRPLSKETDQAEREIVLNYLLVGILGLSVVTFFITLIGSLLTAEPPHPQRLMTNVITTLFIIALYYAARRLRLYKLVAIFLTLLITLFACVIALTWGMLNPVAVLLFSLSVVMAGVLIGARYSLFMACFLALVLAGLQQGQVSGTLHPDLSWLGGQPIPGDVISFSTILLLIALVSWLFNRQMEMSLKRAQRSEKALKHQKALLEIKVEKRAQQLEAAQLEKMQELYRFAELGRLSTALFHDLANHLSTVSLDIEGLSIKDQSGIMKRISENVGHIDTIVRRVREQIRGKSAIEVLNVVDEINEVIKILSATANQAKVAVRLEQDASVKAGLSYRGDVIRFRQIILNLICNGIEAYPPAAKSGANRMVTVRLGRQKTELLIAVADNGVGIAPKDQVDVFRPFYTTKGKGVGIGLFIVKQVVENDFGGTIVLLSDKRHGTTVNVSLPKSYYAKNPEIDAAIACGLAFLAKQQPADGSFISFSSASPQPFRRLRSWQTTFVPALMLASLSGLDEPAALEIRGRLADFLMNQKDDNWALNYWARRAPEYRSMPYPNDLDDTFCALAALRLHDASLVDEAVLARAVKLLLATETAVGGPYRTWLVSPDSEPVWLDVDMAVNSNIAYFLSLTGNRLPSLDALMGEAIAQNAFSSPYYPFEPAFVYYFARAYEGPEKARLLRKTRRLQAATGNSLDRALCLSACLRLDDSRHAHTAIDALMSEQRPDGSWPAAAFYADPVKNGKLYYNGGAALTTAFVLEALQLYKQSLRQRPTRSRPRATNFQTQRFDVLTLARHRSKALPPELRKSVSRSLIKIVDSSNGEEIIGLPLDFSRSLTHPSRSWPKDFLAELGLANLNGWLAYTIYDDFLDDEGRANLLPAANVAMRESLHGFLKALPNNTTFQQLVREAFDTIDGANAWELAHCRFKTNNETITIGTMPDYGDRTKLAERSLGHTLAPLAVLSAAGVSGQALHHTKEALKQYLIARQLNDDLHDWQQDLNSGHITYVVARLLSGLRITKGRHTLAALQATAQPRFWYVTLPSVCREMRQHIAKGRRALRQAGIFTDDTIIAKLLDSLEASVEDTLAQQHEAENFLKHYRQKASV